jgi:hypothetical protein
VLLHGVPGKQEYYDPSFPSASNSHWLPWLQKQLLIHGIAAYTPEIPQAWKPDYLIWAREFERYDIDSNTTLVGHSCGAGFIVRWLSEHSAVTVDKVVLVAPWLDPDRASTTDFFDFVIDPYLHHRTSMLTILNSDNDDQDVQHSVRMIRQSVAKVDYREFHGYGHFCLNDIGTQEFPELLDLLL